MRSRIQALTFSTVLVLLPAVAFAGSVDRYALVAGANLGGSDRPPLRYAVSDAERFARVLQELGGLPPANTFLLRQPRLKELVDALEQIRSRVAAHPPGTGRTEVLVYYSGHADEKGLLIGEDRYSYRSLRDRLEEIPADVRIAVLDACASGALTRLKGGKLRQPFLVDESAEMRGHAFLTSSAETEAAQESDHIGSSYFTHYLVSGLRGAADASGEGKVTLNEAYQFAFGETLGRTAGSQGGAQHPSFDINLSGTGEVVITDLRQTTATLVIGEAVDGRLFVRNARGELVVELSKPFGRRVELGLEPGRYEVRVEREAASLLARPEVVEGTPFVLEPNLFTPTRPQPTRRRGGPPPSFLAGRNRVQLAVGVHRMFGDAAPVNGVIYGADNTSLAAGVEYTHFLREDLALTLAVRALPETSGASIGPEGAFAGDASVVALPLGLRWYPRAGAPRRLTLEPYLTVGVGPVIGSSSGASLGPGGVFSGSRSGGTVGGVVGGGADIQLSRRWGLDLSAGFVWMGDFPDPVGGRDNHSGFDCRLGIGWSFGRSRAPQS